MIKILSIPIFFTIGNNSKMPPKSSQPIKSNADKLNKAKYHLGKTDGSIFNNLDVINDFLKRAVSSNTNVKIGHSIASLVEHITNSLLHD